MNNRLIEMAKSRLQPKLRDLASRHGSNAKAASAWGVPLRTLAGYLAGEFDPKLSFLEAVAEAEGITLGEFFNEDADFRTAETLGMVSIPMRDVYASAGPGAENGDEPIVGYMQFPEAFVRSWGRSPTRVEAIQARGDSMYPTIADRQWVLVDRAERAMDEGKIFAFRTPDGLRLKRFQRAMDGAAMLVSDNRDLYAPERLANSDLLQLKVAGRVFLTPRMI